MYAAPMARCQQVAGDQVIFPRHSKRVDRVFAAIFAGQPHLLGVKAPAACAIVDRAADSKVAPNASPTRRFHKLFMTTFPKGSDDLLT